MNNKYISFSCITCKSQISQLKECNTVYCPQCNDIDIFENELFPKTNENSQIDLTYFPCNIFESKIYSNSDKILPDVLDKDEIEDLRSTFKNVKINYLCLDVKSFNELNTNIFKGSNIFVFLYINESSTLFTINTIIEKFSNKIPTNITLVCFSKISKISKVGIYYD